jgi:hypothetical protein
MTKVTDAIIKTEEGKTIIADALGNNIAILCPNCKRNPLLIIARENQKGSTVHNPATCSVCRKSYYIISDLSLDELKEVIIKEC